MNASEHGKNSPRFGMPASGSEEAMDRRYFRVDLIRDGSSIRSHIRPYDTSMPSSSPSKKLDLEVEGLNVRSESSFIASYHFFIEEKDGRRYYSFELVDTPLIPLIQSLAACQTFSCSSSIEPSEAQNLMIVVPRGQAVTEQVISLKEVDITFDQSLNLIRARSNCSIKCDEKVIIVQEM